MFQLSNNRDPTRLLLTSYTMLKRDTSQIYFPQQDIKTTSSYDIGLALRRSIDNFPWKTSQQQRRIEDDAKAQSLEWHP